MAYKRAYSAFSSNAISFSFDQDSALLLSTFVDKMDVEIEVDVDSFREIVEVPVEKIVHVEVEKVVTVPQLVEVPVERLVEKVVTVPEITERDVPVEELVEKVLQVPEVFEYEIPVEQLVEKVVEVIVENDQISALTMSALA